MRVRRRARSSLVASALVLPLTLALAACGDGGNETDVTIYSGTPTVSDSPTPSAPASSSSTTDSPTEAAGPPEVVATIATGLEAPWGLDFFPNGDAIVTERDSRRLLRVTPAGDVTEIAVVETAEPTGNGAEDGLLGVALSPDFADDSLVFLYLSTSADNQVVRAPLVDGRLGDLEVLLDGIPHGSIHDGGRLEFGPDGLLYVSTGETGEGDLAQDQDSLGGKILRLTPDGQPAPDNPFGTAVWSFGHRNVQGLAFDDDGQLWASEFGEKTYDELNRIEPGSNYGWPEVEGAGGEPTYVDPQQTWATDDNSPSGLAYADGALWMASLQGERLWRVGLDGDQAVDPQPFFVGEYGRMRTIALAPDGTLWLTTSNRDQRGTPREGDDQILQIRP